MDHRICPTPLKWDEFWRVIGSPEELEPLVLGGWAFSTNRRKRERFNAQFEYASKIGLGSKAEQFLARLQEQDWHYCSEASLDYDYGKDLMEEHEETLAREAAAREEVEKAKRLIAILRDLSPVEAFSPQNLDEFLHRFSIRFDPSGTSHADRIMVIEQCLALDNQTEWEVAATACVEERLALTKLNLEIELLLLKILVCQATHRNLDENANFWDDVVEAELP